MRKGNRLLTALLAIAIAVTAVSAAGAAAYERFKAKNPSVGVIAEIEPGKVLGRQEDSVYIFKGIKYATADRWEMPVKPAPWAEDQFLNAQYQGPVSPWLGGSGEYMSDPAYYRIDESEEDFLNLNVWTTSMKTNAKKPVLFWIHGGGYSNGSSLELETYDGQNLSEFGDVVVVSVNHRLNVLGYGVDLSLYDEKFEHSANIGHADLIMALEWVRDNIATFGGDANNVTIWGQSGGAGKVSQLMAMPAADGLFHRAIAMSTGSFTMNGSQEAARANTATLISNVRDSNPDYAGLSDMEIIEILQAMPYRDLRDAASAAGIRAGTVVDNEYVLSDISHSAGTVELMVGTVIGEFNSGGAMGLVGSYRNGSILVDEDRYYGNNNNYLSDQDVMDRYIDRYGDDAGAVIAAFQKAYPTHDLFDGLYVDTFIRGRGRNTAIDYTNAGGTAYNYLMAYTQPLFGGIILWHTGDIPYYFRNLDKVQSWVAGDEQDADKASFDAATAIVNFARTGNPSRPGLPWPVFTIEDQEVMVFDRKSEARPYADFDKDFQDLN